MTDRSDQDTTGPDTPDDSSLRAGTGDRLQPGAMVGRYRVLHRLGRGGMSEVYAAYDARLDRGVALKIMKVDRGHQAHERLELEGRALARLGHRNVVVVHDVGAFGDEMFVAMEHVRGVPLSVWVRDAPHWSELTALFVQAARGLVAAHAAHIVHRDFKPANVMVETDTDRVVVLDFGLARVRGFDEEAPVDCRSVPSGSGDSTHSAVGTPGYMAPELLRGDGASEASDQFAFFVSMFETLYGSRPFRGRHVVELLAAMDTDVLPTLPKERVCPAWLQRIIAKGLRADPGERHPSMASVLEQLESGLAPPRRSTSTSAAVAGVAAIALAGGAAWWTQRSPDNACADAHHDQLASAWHDAERSAVASAIAASDRPHAAETSPRLLARLDRFSQVWSATAQQSCDRSQQTTAAHTRAVDACLDRALDRLRVTTETLRSATDDAKVADRALQLAMSLPEVTRCLDEPAAESAASPERAAASAAIARSVAARVLGDKGVAEAQSDIAVDTALSADRPELLADARLERTRVYDALARYDDALAEAAAALAVATEHDLPHRVALASMELLRLVGDRARSFEEAERWRVLARAAASRLPADAHLRSRLAWIEGTVSWRAGALDRARAQLEHALARTQADAETGTGRDEQLAGIATELGMVLDRLGDSEGARVHVERALEIRRAMFGPQHPAVADALGDLAVVAGRAGRTEEALRMGREALRIYDEGVDADHPTAATLSMNIALELYGQGRHEEALPSFDRAVRTRSAVFGADHLSVAYARATRAPSLAATGRTQDATRDLESAIDTIEASLGPNSPDLMGPLTNLGNIYSTLQPTEDNIPRALASHTRAHAIALEALGPNHASVGIGAQNLGDLLREQGDCERALPYFERALAIFTTQRGAKSAEVAYPLTSIAECRTAAGDPQSALEPLERAAEIRAAKTIDPTERGKTLLALAAAHHGLGDPHAARTAASAAVDAFGEGGTAGVDMKREALAWVRETLDESEQSDETAVPVGSN